MPDCTHTHSGRIPNKHAYRVRVGVTPRASQTRPREPNVKATHPDTSLQSGASATHHATRTITCAVTDWIRLDPIELPAESHAHVCTQRPPTDPTAQVRSRPILGYQR